MGRALQLYAGLAILTCVVGTHADHHSPSRLEVRDHNEKEGLCLFFSQSSMRIQIEILPVIMPVVNYLYFTVATVVPSALKAQSTTLRDATAARAPTSPRSIGFCVI